MSFDKDLLKHYEITATGEPDQDYDHEFYDAIVDALKTHGYQSMHQEFDKYQGIFIDIKLKKGGKARVWSHEFFPGDESMGHVVYLMPEDTAIQEEAKRENSGDGSIWVGVKEHGQGKYIADVDELVSVLKASEDRAKWKNMKEENMARKSGSVKKPGSLTVPKSWNDAVDDTIKQGPKKDKPNHLSLVKSKFLAKVQAKQTEDNWQGEGCKNYDDSQDVCLDKEEDDKDK